MNSKRSVTFIAAILSFSVFFGWLLGSILVPVKANSSHTVSSNAAVEKPSAELEEAPAMAQSGCPPMIISANVNTGATNYTTVTGNQNGRLNRDNNTSRCGASKAAPSVLDTGTQYQFNAYSFNNTSSSAACISVSASNKSAAAVFMAAYLEAFNPNSVAQNYLADAGGAGEGRSFSFTVPANSNFVLVFSRVTTGAVTINYSFNVIGLPGCSTCPPSRIDGDINNGSTDYVAMQGTSNGRLNRDGNTSRCGVNKATPSVFDTGTAFQFDAYTFVNSSSSPACISVALSSPSNDPIFAQAYLDSFNQNNIAPNYLADAGGAGTGRSLAFTVPANRAFVLVFSRVNTGAATITYSFNVIGLPTCQICPPARVAGNTSTGSTQYLAHSSVQDGILGRDGNVSACGSTKPTPNVLSSGTDFDFNAYNFVNISSSSACITVATITDSLTNVPISVVAYLDNFNQNNIQQNYLADSGAVGKARSFSFTVPAQRSFVLVFHRTTTGGTAPGTYRFSVTGLNGCSTCPPQTITSTLGIGTVQTVLDFTDLQTGIPNRPGTTVTESCSTGETFPGLFDAATNVKFDAYMFTNPADVADCFDIVLRNNTTNTGIFASVYLDSFNRQNLATNYFADAGTASPYRSFSVTIPAKRTFIVVVSQINTSNTTIAYDLAVRGLSGCSTCPGVSVTPATLGSGRVGQAYNQTLGGTGGTSPYGFVLSNNNSLPDGLGLNQTTGAIIGTPTVNGSFTFEIQAIDDNLCLGNRTYTLNIQPSGGCTFSLSPTSAFEPATGGTSGVSVVTQAGCNWTLTASAPWLTFPSGNTGVGSNTVNYQIAANTGASRTGTISIPTITPVHTVFQATNNTTQDSDNDGIPDSVEISEGTNPLVRDNDIFANNINGHRRFVMQQYRDFLNREGDTGGINNWVNALSSNSLTRAQVIESFFNSTEFQNTGAPIVRLYFACFLRIPDYAGLQNWINAYRGGMTLDAIANAFVTSAEFLQTYGNLNNTQFVTLVYNNVLGRQPDPTGLNNWVNALNNGMSRGTLMVNFSESQEYKNRIGNSVYVTMMYVGMLRRSPDQAGFNNWVNYLVAGNSGLDLINGFIGAQEYRNRFLP